jgi:hypothetical protein
MKIRRHAWIGTDCRARRLRPSMAGLLVILVISVPASGAPQESPHWNKTACGTCHSHAMPVDSSDLKMDDHSEGCADCHNNSSAAECPHSSGLRADSTTDSNLTRIYHDALADGQIVCTTCHATELQCTGNNLDRYGNPSFLRGGPYRQFGEVCFECHDNVAYQKLDPHQEQVTERGASCTFCHTGTPDEAVPGSSALRLIGNSQCTGCHTVAPHPLSMAPGATPGTWTHLVVPDEVTVQRMLSNWERSGIALPLQTDTGEINCATCHNPHDVESSGYPLRSAPDSKNRLRLSNICEACHDK